MSRRADVLMLAGLWDGREQLLSFAIVTDRLLYRPGGLGKIPQMVHDKDCVDYLHCSTSISDLCDIFWCARAK